MDEPRTIRWKWSLSSSPTVGSSGSFSSWTPSESVHWIRSGISSQATPRSAKTWSPGWGRNRLASPQAVSMIAAGRDLRRGPPGEFEEIRQEVVVGIGPFGQDRRRIQPWTAVGSAWKTNRHQSSR